VVAHHERSPCIGSKADPVASEVSRSTSRWRRWLTRAAIVLSGCLLLAVVAAAGVWLANDRRIDQVRWEQQTQRQVDRARRLAARASTFDESAALEALGHDVRNGFRLRVADHLEELPPSAADGAAMKPEPPEATRNLVPLSLEFDDEDECTFAAGGGRVEDGRLLIARTRTQLETRCPMNVERAGISEIHIRVRLREGRKVRLGWTFEKGVGNAMPLLTLPPDGRFHTYRVRAEAFTQLTHHKQSRPEDVRIRGLVLWPSDVVGDRVEVEFIRLVSRAMRFARQPVGHGSFTLADEMRTGIHVNSPRSVRFAFDAPAQSLSLRFGAAVVDARFPIDVDVVATSRGTTTTVAQVRVANADAWRDHAIDLSSLSGAPAEIRLDVTGGPSTLLLSDPVVIGRPLERRHLIIVLEDTLRADHLSSHGYARKTSPARDDFFGQGVIFLNGISQATKTRPSCPTLMTSLYATSTGVWSFHDTLDEGFVTLAEVMRARGYETGAFVQNPNAGAGANVHQGFDTYFGHEALGRAPRGLHGVELQRWLQRNVDRNVFLYLHAVDPHGPYDPDEQHREFTASASGVGPALKATQFWDPPWVGDATTRAERVARYDDEIAMLDTYFGRFVEQLDSLGMLDDALFVFVSDHGEYLGEFGRWGHHPPGNLQGIHVPMMMRMPGKLPAGERVVEPVALIDVVPTVLELLDIDAGPLMLQGDSLLSLVNGERGDFWADRIVVSEEVLGRTRTANEPWGSVFVQGHHLVNSARFGAGRLAMEGTPWLRGYEYAVDPTEQNPLLSIRLDPLLRDRMTSFVSTLQSINRDIQQRVAKGAIAYEPEDVIDYDPREVERLKALGYLQ